MYEKIVFQLVLLPVDLEDGSLEIVMGGNQKVVKNGNPEVKKDF